MSFKHVRIEFSIDIDEHKRDLKYQKQKALESLKMAIEHIEKNGLHRTIQFDDEGMIPLFVSANISKYAYCRDAYNSIKHLLNYASTGTKEQRLRYKQAFENKPIKIKKTMATPTYNEKISPMYKQFLDLKKKHPDAIILFRCGDFYETYKNDAVEAAKILGITITKSSRIKDEEGNSLAMAGFPYHALDSYIPKLIRAGQRVAICDQIDIAKHINKR